MKSKKILAWHFCNGFKLSDGQDLIVGKTYTYKDPIKLCRSGYHASIKLIDALGFAHGSVLSRVEMSGDIIKDDDKLVASKRKVLWAKDVDKELHEFACTITEAALMIADISDGRCWDAIQAKRLWLEGLCSYAQVTTSASDALCHWTKEDAAYDALDFNSSSRGFRACKGATYSAAHTVASPCSDSIIYKTEFYKAYNMINKVLESLFI